MATHAPTGNPPGNPPSGTTSGQQLCCACPVKDTISTNGAGTYFNAGYPHSGVLTNKCLVDVTRTASGGTVKITKTFSLTYQAGATAKNDGLAVFNAIKGAVAAWTSAAAGYKVHVEQTGCPPQDLKIAFDFKIVTSGADVAVQVDGTPNTALRSYVLGGTQMVFYTAPTSAAWVMTHEVGHCYGQPDEYTTIAGLPIVPPPQTGPFVGAPIASPVMTYIGTASQQGTKSVTLTLNPGFAPAATDTAYDYTFDAPAIMGQHGNVTYPIRNFFWVAIEVKKLLAAQGAPAKVAIV